MMITRKTVLSIAAVLTCILILSACGSDNRPASDFGRVSPESSAVSRISDVSAAPDGTSLSSSAVSSASGGVSAVSSAITPAATKAPAKAPTVSPTETPAAENQPIWEKLGLDAQEFAKTFSAKDCSLLEYTFYGEGGATVAKTKDQDLIQSVFDALCKIRVVGITDIVADDYDDVFRFHMKDSEFAVRFNMHNLDASTSYFLIENDSDLWTAAKAIPDENSEPAFDTVVSEVMNFSFTCNAAYDNEEDPNGQISVYLYSGIASHPYVRIGRLRDGTDALQYLETAAKKVRNELSDKMQTDPGTAKLLEINGRDLYQIRSEFYMDDLDMVYLCYAEEYEDDSVVYYCALCEKQYEGAASDVLDTAIESIWVGELPDSGETSSSITGAPEERTAGRWIYTETILPDGDIEFCLDRSLIVTIPQSWAGKVSWETDGDYFDFYHIDSHERFAEEGYLGGLLFSIVHYTDNSYEYLPSYEYLGRAKDGSYVMVFPEEEQAYTGDWEIQNDWEALFNGIDYVLDHSYSMVF